MTDVFISYSRTDKERVAQLAGAIEAEGYAVWWDAELPPHMSYGEVITAKIESARAAVVVWSPEAAASEWVRAEADAARNQKKLIQTALSDIIPPLPFNQIQCADLSDWNGEPDHPGWCKVKQSLVALCGERGSKAEAAPAAPAAEAAAPPPAPAPARASAPPLQPATLMDSAAGQNGSNRPQLIFVGVLAVLAVIAAAVTFMGADAPDADGTQIASGGSGDGPVDPNDGTLVSQQPQPTAAPTPVRVDTNAQGPGDGLNRDVSLINKSGETIMFLYWSNVDEEYWGDDRLGSDILADGDSWYVTVADNTGACAFDMLGVTASGREIVRPGVNVCSVYEVTFD